MLSVQTDVGNCRAAKPSAQPAPPSRGEHTTSAVSLYLFKYFLIWQQKTSKGSNPPLLSYDKTLFNEYAELVRLRFIRIYNVAYSDSLLKHANIVLDELNKEYHH